MEGSAGSIASTPASAPAARQKKTMTIAVFVVVAVALAALAVVLVLNSGGATDPSEPWGPTLNDWIDYSTWMDGAANVSAYMVVTGSTPFSVTWHETIGTQTDDVTMGSHEIIGPGEFHFDPDNLPTGMTLVGKSVVTTDWGKRNCDHYSVVQTTGHGDVYVYGNVLVRMEYTAYGHTTAIEIHDTSSSLVLNG